MTRYKAPSIRDEGLAIHLDSTKSKHKGFDYAAFSSMVKAKVNTSNLARAMGVSRATMDYWLTIYREEQGTVDNG